MIPPPQLDKILFSSSSNKYVYTCYALQLWLSAFMLQCLSALTCRCVSTPKQMKCSAVRVTLRCPSTALTWYSSIDNISMVNVQWIFTSALEIFISRALWHSLLIGEGKNRNKQKTSNTELAKVIMTSGRVSGLKSNEKKRSLNYVSTTNQIPFTSISVHFYWAGWKKSQKQISQNQDRWNLNYPRGWKLPDEMQDRLIKAVALLVRCNAGFWMKWGRKLLWRHEEWLQCRRAASPQKKEENPVISSSLWRVIGTTVRLSTPYIITTYTRPPNTPGHPC